MQTSLLNIHHCFTLDLQRIAEQKPPLDFTEAAVFFLPSLPKTLKQENLGNMRLHHVYRCVFGGTQYPFLSPISSFTAKLWFTREPSASLETIQFLTG